MTVKVSMNKNRIIVRADRKIKALHKRIPGANFAQTGGAHWTLPLTLDSCTLLRKTFKKELEIDPELNAWALARKRRDRAMRQLGKSESAELAGLFPSKNPKLWKAVTKVRPYQGVGAKFIAEGRSVIVADGVGLGKSAQVLAGIMESQLPGPYLIVCPKTAVESTWRPEIERWLPNHNVITCPDGRDGRNKVLNELAAEHGTKDFLVVNQDMLRTKSYWLCMNWLEDADAPKGRKRCGKITYVTAGTKKLDCKHDPTKTKLTTQHEYPQLFDITWSAIVADESDKCLLRKTKLSTQTRRGMELLNVRADGIKVAQSATPWRSRPHLLWSTLNWLFPDEHTAFWPWVELLYEIDEGFDGAKVIAQLNPDRESMLYKTLNSIMIRRTKQEVAKHLPRRLYIGTPYTPSDETSPVGIWLPMTKPQQRAYDEMEADAEARIRGGEVTAIGGLAELTRLRQFASSYAVAVGESMKPSLPSNKFDYLVDTLASLGFPDDPQTKVIVVSSWTAMLELFAKEMRKKHKIDSVMITGKVTGKQRAWAKDIFNDPDASPHLLFMNNKAGGSSITLDAADEMIFIDETHVADDQEQCEGRNDNRRPEEKIVQRRYRYLRSLNTVEVGMAHVNAASSAEDRRLLDERRGVKYLIDVLDATVSAKR